jgi:hypothetical protein
VNTGQVLVAIFADDHQFEGHLATEFGSYIQYCADDIWLFVPIQQKVNEFLTPSKTTVE